MDPLEQFVVSAFLATADDLKAARNRDIKDPQDRARTELHALISDDEEAHQQVSTDHYDKRLDRAGYLYQTNRISARLEDNRRKPTIIARRPESARAAQNSLLWPTGGSARSVPRTLTVGNRSLIRHFGG